MNISQSIRKAKASSESSYVDSDIGRATINVKI